MTQALHFEDPEFVRRYAEGPGRFVPGYSIMQAMAAQLLRERMGADGEVLVVGAGGGLELEAFARTEPGWRFVGVDPAAEMIAAGRQRMESIGASDRVRWIHGHVFDAPSPPFDGATCLLTLHFVPDDGAKLGTLRAIRDRLRPGAPFMLVDLCIDLQNPSATQHLERYRRFALQSGADRDDVEATCARLVEVLKLVSAERDEALLRDAGFSNPELFYAGLSWRGWVAQA